jgi:hypothetical protein
LSTGFTVVGRARIASNIQACDEKTVLYSTVTGIISWYVRRRRKRVCDDRGDDGSFGVNCYRALAREG